MKYSELPDDFDEKFHSRLKFRNAAKKGYNRGIDTETDKEGNLVLIATDNDYILNRSGISSYDALNFILSKARHSFFWLFNLQFDYEVITKSALANSDSKGIEAFRSGNYIITKSNEIQPQPTFLNKYTGKPSRKYPNDCIGINYIEGRTLSIRKKKCDKAECYDVANFINEGGLDNTAKELLGEGKGNLGNEYINITDSSKIPEDVLIQRCMKDAELTKKLGVLVDKTIRDIAGKMGYSGNFKFLSNASLAKTLIVNTVSAADLKPFYSESQSENYRALVKQLQRYAKYSYKGGLFLLNKKGSFENLDKIDISSAYPNILRTLKSLDGANFIYTTTLNKKSDYGFYNVTMQYDGFTAYRTRANELIYPKTTDEYPNYITKDELLFLRNRGYKVSVVDGYEIYCSKEAGYPFNPFVKNLSGIKQENKDIWNNSKKNGSINTKSHAVYLLTKLVLNSLYGSLTQSKHGLGIISNFVYSAVITARTRIQLVAATERYFTDWIEVATDSITGYLKPEYKGFFDGNHHLGQFENETIPEDLVMLQVGVNFVVNEGTYDLYKSRGFGFKATKGNSTVKGKVTIGKDKVIIDTTKPLHSKEAIAQGRISEIAEFQETRKEISFNDPKRIWANSGIEWDDLLDTQIDSMPYNDGYFLGIDEDYLVNQEIDETLKGFFVRGQSAAYEDVVELMQYAISLIPEYVNEMQQKRKLMEKLESADFGGIRTISTGNREEGKIQIISDNQKKIAIESRYGK